MGSRLEILSFLLRITRRFPHFLFLIVQKLFQRWYTLHRRDFSHVLGRFMANDAIFLQISRRTRSSVGKVEGFSLSKAAHLSCLDSCLGFMFQHIVLLSIWPLRVTASEVVTVQLSPIDQPSFQSTLNLALTCTPHKCRQNVQICITEIVKLQPTCYAGRSCARTASADRVARTTARPRPFRTRRD